jgi:hypothetical protein
MRGSLLGFVVVLVAATPAAAVIDYGVGPVRYVTTTTGGSGPGTGDLEENHTTGFWSALAESTHSTPCPCPPFGGGGSASATATQVSDLGDLEISMSGALVTSATEGYVGHATSYLGVSFTLASDSPYVSSLITLGPNVQDFNLQRAGNFPIDANSSGTLLAGNYSLVVDIRASTVANTSGLYAYNLLIVPEPSCACLMLIGVLFAGLARRRSGRR